MVSKRKPRKKNPPVIRNCLYCGESYAVKNYAYLQKFCSKTCNAKSRIGEKGAHWLGGITIREDKGRKYVSIYQPGHPNANHQGYVREHHLVMEKTIGRFLKEGEIVHHINGNGLDNRPENLVLCSHSSHATIHIHKGRKGFLKSV
jgi:hypothetical protein